MTPSPPAAAASAALAAVTVAPWEIDNEPKPALPTVSAPAICQLEPAPVTSAEELAAEAVLAITAPAEVVTVPPASMARPPRPASPTMNVPVLANTDSVPVTVTSPVAPAAAAMSIPPPTSATAWFSTVSSTAAALPDRQRGCGGKPAARTGYRERSGAAGARAEDRGGRLQACPDCSPRIAPLPASPSTSAE